jgi:hypothetical protein
LRTKGQLDSTSCHASHQLQFGGQIVYWCHNHFQT